MNTSENIHPLRQYNDEGKKTEIATPKSCVNQSWVTVSSNNVDKPNQLTQALNLVSFIRSFWGQIPVRELTGLTEVSVVPFKARYLEHIIVKSFPLHTASQWHGLVFDARTESSEIYKICNLAFIELPFIWLNNTICWAHNIIFYLPNLFSCSSCHALDVVVWCGLTTCHPSFPAISLVQTNIIKIKAKNPFRKCGWKTFLVKRKLK
jgi:hypothetical protein